MDIGCYTFADIQPDPQTGRATAPSQRLREVVEEIELADQVGLDVFGIGEHHRPEYVVSAPAVVLAAAAERTKHIRLSSAVSVLSSDDPVRVFQQFATVDLLSQGRAELMVGRGSFIESFPLFGYSLDDYDTLFAEKLDLLLQLRTQDRISWSGTFRPSLEDAAVFPRPYQTPLPVWLAVGGTPNSVIRAAELGLPLALAIIGGAPAQFAPLIRLYREAAAMAELPDAQTTVGINSIGYIADTSQQAADELYPAYAAMMNVIGKERGWRPLDRAGYDALRGPRGALFVGSPQEIIDKILYEYELFHHQRFLLQLSFGALPHAAIMHAIELLGTAVAPVVRRATAPPTTD